MLKIVKTSKKSAKDFNEKAWHTVDFEHYGRRVEWKERKFRFKALDGKRIVGTISGKFESGVLHIGALIVDKNERKKGIGKALMQEAEEFGVRLGAHKIYLQTGKNWEERRKNYRKAFDAYLREYGLRKREFSPYGIGSITWVLERRQYCRDLWKSRLEDPSPPG